MEQSKNINVLSLFDGMSCGQIALNKLGIKYDNYYASEIDKFAIAITKKNYPNTIHLGDVRDVKGEDLPKIDLLFGGSPCQSFSNAGNGKGFEGSSGIFWEYVRVLREVKPKYFMLENVKMKKEWQDIITKELGVEPIAINSSLLSGQNRPRLYWTNIPGVEQPEDKGIKLKDILEDDNLVDKQHLMTPKAMAYMDGLRNGKQRWDYHKNPLDGKAACIVASFYKLSGLGVLDYRTLSKPCRRLTPVECERLQTVPDNYTESASRTQRYKMIGNGWTVDVIAHIFSYMKL
jgi:DNA (cytosine-5)-methyltransferase 3A